MPIRDLPAPTGPHPVGTVSYDLVDPARPEQYRLPESDSPARRTIRLQLWYPAAEEDAASGAPSPWMPDGPRHVRGIVRTHGFPSCIWEHTRFMSSNSYHAAAPGGPLTYPLAIIVHGWEGYRGLHADIAEELASYGYLVAAADHSYGAAATRLEDGTMLRARDDVLPDREIGELFAERAAQLVATFAADIASIREHLATLDDRVPPGPAPAATLSGANRAVLDALSGRVDPGNLSLIGHSTGGGAAVAYALDHPQVAALVGLDAWVEPLGQRRLHTAGLTMPSLFLKSEEWIGHHNEPFLEPWLSRQQAAGLPVTFEQTTDTTHAQFSALYMYAPGTRWVGLLGDTDPRAFAMYQRQRIREFVLGQRQ